MVGLLGASLISVGLHDWAVGIYPKEEESGQISWKIESNLEEKMTNGSSNT